MYGPGFLVNPVTEQGASMRHLYLPPAKWYDFWNGIAAHGGMFVDVTAPLDRMPLYVRAGSIIPLGPEEEYSDQKAPDPLEIRVYPGADGAFTLYEDENDNYNYEKGKYATIPLQWNDGTRTLTIGARKGSFPGMLEDRRLHITFVRDNHGVGVEQTASPDQTVQYSGREVSVTAK
jgi:alpha-D-xyloside xylohydrolase